MIYLSLIQRFGLSEVPPNMLATPARKRLESDVGDPLETAPRESVCGPGANVRVRPISNIPNSGFSSPRVAQGGAFEIPVQARVIPATENCRGRRRHPRRPSPTG